ncbi:hypothetical protein FACS1894198_6990 [Clostridia bacterium]|nr:hypothetical protein FACS1894198_6990 [Clostridia bacterium]
MKNRKIRKNVALLLITTAMLAVGPSSSSLGPAGGDTISEQRDAIRTAIDCAYGMWSALGPALRELREAIDRKSDGGEPFCRVCASRWPARLRKHGAR